MLYMNHYTNSEFADIKSMYILANANERAAVQNFSTSVQALAVTTGKSRTSVHRVLQSEVLHPFMNRGCSYYYQMIIHNALCSHSGLLTKMWQTCTLQIS